MRRWRLGLLGVVLVLVAIISGTLAWLVGTEVGSGWAIRQAAARLPAGISLSVGRVEGRLLDQLTLDDIRLQLDGSDLNVTRLRLDWRPLGLLAGRLRVIACDIDGVDYRAGPASAEPTEPWQGLSLPLALDVQRLAVTDATVDLGTDSWRIPAASLNASWQGERLRVREFRLEARQAETLTIDVTTVGRIDTTEQLPLDLQLHWQGTLPELGNSQGRGAVEGDLQQLQLTHRLEKPLALGLSGTVTAAEPPRFQLALEWQRLSWPPAGAEPVFAAGPGTLKLGGSPSDYRLQLESVVTAPAYAMGALALNADGDAAGLKPFEMKLAALDGEMTAAGELAWSGEPRLKANLTASGVDPSRVAGPAGRLDFVLATDLQLPTAGPAGTIRIEQLSGELAGQPLAGTGRISLTPERIDIEALSIDNGRNRIEASGSVGKSLALTGRATIAGLDQYLPQAFGAIEADWKVGGTAADPQLSATMSSAGIGWGDVAVDALNATVDWPGREAQRPFDVALDLSGLHSGELHFDQARFDAAGRLQRHRLNLRMTGDTLSLDTSAAGGLDGQLWSGMLERLELRSGAVQQSWELRETVPVELRATSARLLESLCLVNAGSTACTDLRWAQADGLAMQLAIADLPVALATPLLPDGWRPDGLAQIDVDLQGKSALRGGLKLSIATIALTTPFTDSDPLQFENVVLNADLDPQQRLAVAASLGVPGHGTVQSRVDATPAGEDGRYRLDGRIEGTLTDLSKLTALTDAVVLEGGRLTMDVGLAGTSSQPIVSGSARLDRLRAGVPALGTEFTDLAVDVSAAGTNRLVLDGGATAGDGRLRFSGALSLDQRTGYPLTLEISGSDALLSRLPEAEVYASPDIRLTGSAEEGFQVRGELLIPKARFEIEEIPDDVVTVSGDQRLVGQVDEDPDTPTMADRIDTELDLRLGEDVQLSGFGLDTRLGGGVSLRAKPQGEPQGFGEIILNDGRYRAYGQDLTIDRGRLIFAGPLDNPGIDLRAFRKSTDQRVTAWLKVSEFASAPQLDVYAEPDMPETEALAYLLTGKGLDESGGADQSRIYAAALGWGVGQGEPLFTQLQDQLGLSTLAFEGGDTIEDSSVQIGKYLDPNLYIGYGLGLFGRTSHVLLRYHLTDHITVESRSGDTQSADVFYQIETD